MIEDSKTQIFNCLSAIENTTKRRAMFLALLNKELEFQGHRHVLLVGGFAVEIFTAGNYATGDIDIKGPRVVIERILLQNGFVKYHNASYGHEYLCIYVHWLGEGPQLPFENAERILTISLGDHNLTFQIICYEDIIIDRLCQTAHWKNSDGLLWAKAIFQSAKFAGQKLDIVYLKDRASQEQVGHLLVDLGI